MNMESYIFKFREMQYSGEAIPDKITITVDTEDHNWSWNELMNYNYNRSG